MWLFEKLYLINNWYEQNENQLNSYLHFKVIISWECVYAFCENINVPIFRFSVAVIFTAAIIKNFAHFHFNGSHPIQSMIMKRLWYLIMDYVRLWLDKLMLKYFRNVSAT